jgi:hypothetical protein
MHRTRHLTALLLAVISLVFAPDPVAALDLAPPPTTPEPSLWAGIEKVCLGAAEQTPGIRWTIGNNTNSKHVFSVYNDGHHVYDTIVEPGEVKTAALSAPQWEDTSRHFQVVWTSQEKVLAQLQPWFNCIEPELSVSFGEVDAQGRPCEGAVAVSVSNTGTQSGQVRILLAQTVVHEFVATVGTSVTVDVEADAGATISGTSWNFGAHEFFFGAEVVECSEDEPDPPDPSDAGGDDQGEPPAGDGGDDQGGDDQDGPSMNVDDAESEGTLEPSDVPGGSIGEGLPEPVVSSFKVGKDGTAGPGHLDLDAEIALLAARHLASGSVGSALPGGEWLLVGTVVGLALTVLVLRRL